MVSVESTKVVLDPLGDGEMDTACGSYEWFLRVRALKEVDEVVFGVNAQSRAREGREWSSLIELTLAQVD